jgi:hypothetical protein
MSIPVSPVRSISCALLFTVGSATAADGFQALAEESRLEAHGFVSFGYFRTWENNYLAADSLDGSDEFYEAAFNATIRPLDRLRLGAQLFVRDLGQYENGAVRLDWAFAEVTVAPAMVIQGGRVKVPVGLYNELQDIDPARTTIFLPQTLYPIRLRDTQASVDGGKISGFLDVPGGTSLDYAVYGGTKNIENDSAFGANQGQRLGATPSDIDVDWTVGGIVHWHTPIDGLGLRLSYTRTNDLEVMAGNATQTSDVEIVALSAEWELPAVTIATEYVYVGNDGDVNTPFGTIALKNINNAGYLSAIWHVTSWLDAYGAVEYQHFEQVEPAGQVSDGWTYVAAFNLMPLSNWSLKVEYQFHDGPVGITSADNPQGVSSTWQVLAFKTTVDF